MGIESSPVIAVSAEEPGPEEPVDGRRRIIDCHHHLWPAGEGHSHGGPQYLFDDLLADIGTHHNVTDTVFVQCLVGYRQEGPEAMRPVGETEFAAGQALKSAGHQARLAGIVATADLTLGDGVEAVLQAHESAGAGLFRGIRHSVYSCPELALGDDAPPPGLLAHGGFRRGLARLGAHGYTFEAFVFHPQLAEVAAAAGAVEETTFVLNHLGGPVNVDPFTDRREVRAVWQRGMLEVAARPNAVLKLGGIGMSFYGTGWDSRSKKPDSDEIAAYWRDDFLWCIDTFGPSRCMFESNFPVDRESVGYVALWNAFQKIAAGFSDEEQDNLFADTAARTYRIDDPSGS